jgi:hypothetical protein
MIKLEAKTMTKAIERAKAIHPKVRVISASDRVYAVTGSKGNTYTVRFVVVNGLKLGSCDCPAGQRGQMCYHVASASQVNVMVQSMRQGASAPIRAYHGTDADFDQFDFALGEPHFTRDREAASQFAKGRHGKQRRIVEADLDIRCPAGLAEWKAALDRASGGNPRGMAVCDLRAQGYDGVVTDYEIIPFAPDQVRIVSAPRIVRSVERDRSGVRVEVVRCDGWAV